ncbi:hypothetical protein BKA70DRAFT_1426554 [Coprinopsis sp. MPI-PUGE-AT-0042]|nr:hypothetical protein BKA70DRAFT_1426554 [Coprinopsis sp. MPI-PUGE-AT-0042]
MNTSSATSADRKIGDSVTKSVGTPRKLRRGARSGGVVVDAREDPPIIDPTDSAYSGRGGSSRVKKKNNPEEEPLSRTRSRRKVQRLPAGSVGSANDETDDEEFTHDKQTAVPAPAKSGRKRAAASSGVASGPPPQPGSEVPSGPKRRRLLSPSPARSSPLTELSSDGDEQDVKRRLFEGERPPSRREDLDGYDLNDPFIDDSAVDVEGGASASEAVSGAASEDDNLVAANAAADADDDGPDAIALAKANRRVREERRRIQIGLDEAMARDEQSDEEEKVVRFAVEEAEEAEIPVTPVRFTRMATTTRTEPVPNESHSGTPVPGPSESPHRSSNTSGSTVSFHDKGKGSTVSKGTPFPPRSRDRAFGVVIANAKKGVDAGHGPTLEELETHRVRELPVTCEVTNVQLQDPLLRKYYKNLPNLRSGVFESWSDSEGPGMIMFSNWSAACPDIDYDVGLSALEFRSSGSFINPCRISPLEVGAWSVPGPRIRSHLHTLDGRPAVCVSPVMCDKSYLQAPPERGLRQKWMSGIFHSQEWERFVGFMATVFGHERLSAQLARDAIQFTTRAHFGKVYEPRSSGGSMSQLFSKVKSPSTKGKARAETSVTADSFALDFDSEVPIYDARDVKFDFNEDLGLN